MADPMKTWFLLAYDGAEQRWYIKKAKATDQTDLRNRVIPAMVQDGIFGGLQAGADSPAQGPVFQGLCAPFSECRTHCSTASPRSRMRRIPWP